MTRPHEHQDSLTVVTTCASCGASNDIQARFCTRCGTTLPPRVVLPLQRTPLHEEEVAAPVRRSRARKPLAITALVAVAAGVGVLALNDRGTHQRLSRTRHSLASTQQQLRTTEAQLAQTASELTSANADLASTKAELTKAQATLKAKEQALTGVQNSLSDAKNSVNVQASQIQTLKSCLNGVQIALSDVAYGDYSGAVSALDAVQVSCNAANAIL